MTPKTLLLKKSILKKVTQRLDRRQQKLEKLPGMQRIRTESKNANTCPNPRIFVRGGGGGGSGLTARKHL